MNSGIGLIPKDYPRDLLITCHELVSNAFEIGRIPGQS
jgi:hypothetical protein